MGPRFEPTAEHGLSIRLHPRPTRTGRDRNNPLAGGKEREQDDRIGHSAGVRTFRTRTVRVDSGGIFGGNEKRRLEAGGRNHSQSLVGHAGVEPATNGLRTVELRLLNGGKTKKRRN